MEARMTVAELHEAYEIQWGELRWRRQTTMRLEALSRTLDVIARLIIADHGEDMSALDNLKAADAQLAQTVTDLAGGVSDIATAEGTLGDSVNRVADDVRRLLAASGDSPELQGIADDVNASLGQLVAARQNLAAVVQQATASTALLDQADPAPTTPDSAGEADGTLDPADPASQPFSSGNGDGAAPTA